MEKHKVLFEGQQILDILLSTTNHNINNKSWTETLTDITDTMQDYLLVQTF